MGTRTWLPALGILAALAAGCVAEPGAEPAREERAVVARVGDGDTLELEDGQRVRLLQIDTPELGDGECYAVQAKEWLEALAPPGARIALEADAALDATDRYERLLRYVRAEGQNVNVELVRLGAATPYFARGERGRYADELLDAVEDARAAGRGMWAACTVDWEPGRQVETLDR